MNLSPDTGEKPADRVSQLRTAELLVLAAGRLWVAHYLDPAGTAARWRDGFRAAGLDQAAAEAFDALFGAFAAGVIRQVAFHCPTCARLGEDEALLLLAFGLLQRGQAMEAQRMLGAWLTPAATRVALSQAQEVADAMAELGLAIPLRDVAPGVFSGSFLLSDEGINAVH